MISCGLPRLDVKVFSLHPGLSFEATRSVFGRQGSTYRRALRRKPKPPFTGSTFLSHLPPLPSLRLAKNWLCQRRGGLRRRWLLRSSWSVVVSSVEDFELNDHGARRRGVIELSATSRPGRCATGNAVPARSTVHGRGEPVRPSRRVADGAGARRDRLEGFRRQRQPHRADQVGKAARVRGPLLQER